MVDGQDEAIVVIMDRRSLIRELWHNKKEFYSEINDLDVLQKNKLINYSTDVAPSKKI